MRRAFLVTSLSGWSSLALLLAAAGGALAEEAKPEEPKEEAKTKPPFAKDDDGVAQYIDLVESKYLPADAEGKGGGVEFKFNLMPTIPRGTTINFDFEFQSLSFSEFNFDYAVKDDNRRGLVAVWKPKRRLGTGIYILAARIYLDKQTPAVLKALEKVDGLPAMKDPWLVRVTAKPIKVGTPEDEAREAREICAFYKSMMEKLVENMGEFSAQMKKVKAGEEMVSGGALDVAAFKKYIAEWRKKQGAVQKEILDLLENEPSLFEKSKTTHVNLIELGRMVSRRANLLQKEITDKYQITEKINPPGHENFDGAYRFKVDADQLNNRMETITAQACPDEKKEEEPKDGEAAAKDGEKEAGSEKPKEEPAPEKPKKTEKKKKKPATK